MRHARQFLVVLLLSIRAAAAGAGAAAAEFTEWRAEGENFAMMVPGGPPWEDMRPDFLVDPPAFALKDLVGGRFIAINVSSVGPEVTSLDFAGVRRLLRTTHVRLPGVGAENIASRLAVIHGMPGLVATTDLVSHADERRGRILFTFVLTRGKLYQILCGKFPGDPTLDDELMTMRESFRFLKAPDAPRPFSDRLPMLLGVSLGLGALMALAVFAMRKPRARTIHERRRVKGPASQAGTQADAAVAPPDPAGTDGAYARRLRRVLIEAGVSGLAAAVAAGLLYAHFTGGERKEGPDPYGAESGRACLTGASARVEPEGPLDAQIFWEVRLKNPSERPAFFDMRVFFPGYHRYLQNPVRRTGLRLEPGQELKITGIEKVGLKGEAIQVSSAEVDPCVLADRAQLRPSR